MIVSPMVNPPRFDRGCELTLAGIAAYTDHYLYARNIAKGGNTAHLKKPDLEKDYILGITFLRYAYVFYDLANNQVEMAAIDHDAVAGKKAKLFIFKDGYD
jgi:hypothetical protein